MGAVDLVIQVESPGAVARGLQRIGRAGHQVGEPSRGKLFPKHRGRPASRPRSSSSACTRASSSTPATRATRSTCWPSRSWPCAPSTTGRSTTSPRWCAGRANFAELSDEVLASVLDLLSGRYPSEEFAELRPRIVWDRVEGIVRGRAGAAAAGRHQRRHHPRPRPVRRVPPRRHPGRRARRGDGLREPAGRDVPARRVHLAHRGHHLRAGRSSRPAPGQPGKMPFWHGDGPGPAARAGPGGRRVRARASARCRAGRGARPGSARRHGLDERGGPQPARRTSTSRPRPPARVPDDRTIVVERFRDEIGDWRVCVLSPFGAQVHAPWAMALQARLAERWGIEVELMWSDDGIVIRLPEAIDELPARRAAHRPRRDRRARRRRQLPDTAMFASRFRECAARALLLPRRRPDQRTPLWQQRQRSADLLAVAAQVPVVPDPARGHPRVPQRRVRPARAARRCCATCAAGKVRLVAGRHAAGVAVRPVAAVRLDRRLHVRGRRAAGRAPGRRARPRPRPAARPARRRGAARAARPRRAGRPRARAPAPGRRPPGPRRRRAPRPAAPASGR